MEDRKAHVDVVEILGDRLRVAAQVRSHFQVLANGHIREDTATFGAMSDAQL